MDFLKGKKTFLVAALGIVINGCVAMGYIDGGTVDIINKVLVFLGLGAIRDGIKTETTVGTTVV